MTTPNTPAHRAEFAPLPEAPRGAMNTPSQSAMEAVDAYASQNHHLMTFSERLKIGHLLDAFAAQAVNASQAVQPAVPASDTARAIAEKLVKLPVPVDITPYDGDADLAIAAMEACDRFNRSLRAAEVARVAAIVQPLIDASRATAAGGEGVPEDFAAWFHENRNRFCYSPWRDNTQHMADCASRDLNRVITKDEFSKWCGSIVQSEKAAQPAPPSARSAAEEIVPQIDEYFDEDIGGMAYSYGVDVAGTDEIRSIDSANKSEVIEYRETDVCRVTAIIARHTAAENDGLQVKLDALTKIGTKLLEIFDHPHKHVSIYDADELREALALTAAPAARDRVAELEAECLRFAKCLEPLGSAALHLSNCYLDGPDAVRVTTPPPYMLEMAEAGWKKMREALNGCTDRHGTATVMFNILKDARAFIHDREAAASAHAARGGEVEGG